MTALATYAVLRFGRSLMLFAVGACSELEIKWVRLLCFASLLDFSLQQLASPNLQKAV
jgi:hypothetical protein